MFIIENKIENNENDKKGEEDEKGGQLEGDEDIEIKMTIVFKV